MTRSEFLARQAAHDAGANRAMCLFTVAFFGVLVANLPLAKWMDRHKPGPEAQVAYGAAIALFFVGSVAWFPFYSKRLLRKHGMLCPACERSLVGFTGQIVLATDRCGWCGSRILEEDGVEVPAETTSAIHPTPFASHDPIGGPGEARIAKTSGGKARRHMKDAIQVPRGLLENLASLRMPPGREDRLQRLMSWRAEGSLNPDELEEFEMLVELNEYLSSIRVQALQVLAPTRS